MLKEMTVLVIVLWSSQGMPTTRSPPEQDLRVLSELYCKAEVLLKEYKSVDEKSLPPETRPVLESMFSQPGCNFTKSAEECQFLPAFHALFLWFKSTYPGEGLLKPVMNTFTLLIELQEIYVNYTCSVGASDKVPQITCPKYPSHKPELENKIHYVFEQYRDGIRDVWRSKLTEEERNATVTDVCGAKN